MKKNVFLTMVLSWLMMPVMAQVSTIDISGDNTDKSYVSYNQSISLPAGKVVDVKMARYCYFYPTITGSGRHLHQIRKENCGRNVIFTKNP